MDVCEGFVAQRRAFPQSQVISHLNDARAPLETPHSYYIVVELSGSNAAHDEEKLSNFLEEVMEAGVVSDGTACLVHI